MIKDCPFCESDADGCCFCDHSGKIAVGPGLFFETEQDYNDAVGKVVTNRENMMHGAVDKIKRFRGESIPAKDYNIDHTINDW